MSARTTPALAALDNLRFARSGETVTGEYPVSGLPRLADMLASEEGVVSYRLSGVLVTGRPALKLVLDATLRLVCQRCLEPFDYRLHVDNVMPVARDERELVQWEREDPLLDAQVADPRMDVRTLVEDEILLGLPIMPRHPDGACGLAGD